MNTFKQLITFLQKIGLLKVKSDSYKGKNKNLDSTVDF
jgi:hypothetical protein